MSRNSKINSSYREFVEKTSMLADDRDRSFRDPALIYAMGSLAVEAAEANQLLLKAIRDNNPERISREAVMDELGDVWWSFVRVLQWYGIGLADLEYANVMKLNTRRFEAGKPTVPYTWERPVDPLHAPLFQDPQDTDLPSA